LQKTKEVHLPTKTPASPKRQVDTLIRQVCAVTVDADRRIIKDAAIAIAGDRIVAIGKTADVEAEVEAKTVIDGRRFVATPGFINGHIHITGEPITRGYVPDDTGWQENVWSWLIPLYGAQTPKDEAISAQFAALEMLRTGTTCFIEAGTINHLDPVVEALNEIGIRGRVAQWADDRAFDPTADQTAMTDKAIKVLEAELTRYPSDKDARIAAWACLVGHMTATDDLWKAAFALARQHGAGIAAHMSPVEVDPTWYLENTGKRPIEHLASLGVLGPNVGLTHAIHLDLNEVAILAQTGANAIHCPMSALKGAYGAGPNGKFPEMQAAGVNILLGTDGNNNSNTSDLMRAMYLVCALFKDARRETGVFPAHEAVEMVTLNGAKALGLSDQIGTLEVGKKADIVLHDTDRPEWRPLSNVINQLVWSADGRGVHTVFVDGQIVVENYRCTTIDEAKLYRDVDQAADGVIARSGLPFKCAWPVV
jgi:cytosine/adenosine deaminase-related metal-dependent hydrolase